MAKKSGDLLRKILASRSNAEALEMVRNAQAEAAADNTKIKTGMSFSDAEKVDAERRRMEKVVSDEMIDAVLTHNDVKRVKFATARNLQDAYKKTDFYKNNRTWAEKIEDRIEGADRFPMYASSGALELFSPVPVNYGNLRFIKNIHGVPIVNKNGSASLSNTKYIFSNYTTDVPFRLHRSYNDLTMPGGEIMLIDPVAFKGKKPWSIHPMDSFFRSHDLADGTDPKNIILLSGNEDVLNKADKLGFKTRTTQPLIDEYSRISSVAKEPVWKDMPLNIVKNYRNMIDDEISKIGRPTKTDYDVLERVTGLKSYTSYDVGNGVKELNEALDLIPLYENVIPMNKWNRSKGSFMVYPDGDFTDFYTLSRARESLKEQLPFHKNVFYNPIPTVESDIIGRIGGHGHQEYDPVYETSLKRLFDDFVKSNPIKANGGPIKDKYHTISNSRVNSARNALIKAGYDRDTANNLSKILAAHSISETGWIDPKDNNYAGHLSGGKRITYPSPEAFWDYHISNLSNRFPGWDKATNMREYDEAINHSSLGLDTEAKFKAYQRAHPNTYIYAPIWDNKNYLKNMESIYNRRILPNVVDPVVEQPSGFSAKALIDASQLPDDQKAILLKDYGDLFAYGGGIHIKKSHRGRLTELKKRTGKSEAELYRTGSPAVRKMITFARNARKWNHANGGFMNRFSTAFDGDTAEMLAVVRKQLLNRN